VVTFDTTQGKTKESIGETWFFKTLKDKKS